MSTKQTPPTEPGKEPQDRQMRGTGIAFLGCGVSFLGIGLSSHMLAFALTAPAFIALGIVFLARARRRGGDQP